MHVLYRVKLGPYVAMCLSLRSLALLSLSLCSLSVCLHLRAALAKNLRNEGEKTEAAEAE